MRDHPYRSYDMSSKSALGKWSRFWKNFLEYAPFSVIGLVIAFSFSAGVVAVGATAFAHEKKVGPCVETIEALTDSGSTSCPNGGTMRDIDYNRNRFRCECPK